MDGGVQRAGLVGARDVPGGVDVRGRAGAVLHTRDEEEAVPGVEIDALRFQGLEDLVVEVDAAAGGDEGVGVAVVVEEFAAVVVEGGEVVVVGGGVAGVELVGELDGVVVEFRVVP